MATNQEQLSKAIIAEHTAKTVTDYLNGMRAHESEFIEAMSREHRTLQQEFTGLCLLWIKHCAELKEFEYDGRNEYSHIKCKEIADAVELPDSMPFI